MNRSKQHSLYSAVVIVLSGFACASPVGADEEGACSNRTLKGDYGFAAEGQILTGPVTGPLRAVGLTKFDGKGNLTRVEFATVNGVAISAQWRPATGIYTVNPDCTGSMEVIPEDGSPRRKLRLVAVRNGREVRTVEETNAVSSIGIRIE